MGIDTFLFMLVIAALVGIAAWFVELERKKYSSKSELDSTLGFTVAELNQAVENGLVSRRSHPDDPELVVLNYTPQVQYSGEWTPVTRGCRGLILRGTKIVARSFPKFYNLGELDELPDLPFVVQPKFDGSLGVTYPAPDGIPAVATRGSFASDQAAWATQYLRSRPELLRTAEAAIAEGETLLVEIIYPENRIVVDYGDYAGLVLLARIENSTGLDLDLPHWADRVAFHDELTLEEIETLNKDSKGDQSEGFVLRYEDGTRVKVKSEDYVRLHRIVTGITPRKIHDMLSENISVEQWAEYVPDEFYEWMKTEAERQQQEFTKIEQEALKILSEVPTAERKVQAEFIKTKKYSGLVFAMLDQKPYSAQIWKMIRPEGDSAFRVDIDG